MRELTIKSRSIYPIHVLPEGDILSGTFLQLMLLGCLEHSKLVALLYCVSLCN